MSGWSVEAGARESFFLMSKGNESRYFEETADYADDADDENDEE